MKKNVTTPKQNLESRRSLEQSSQPNHKTRYRFKLRAVPDAEPKRVGLTHSPNPHASNPSILSRDEHSPLPAFLEHTVQSYDRYRSIVSMGCAVGGTKADRLRSYMEYWPKHDELDEGANENDDADNGNEENVAVEDN